MRSRYSVTAVIYLVYLAVVAQQQVYMPNFNRRISAKAEVSSRVYNSAWTYACSSSWNINAEVSIAESIFKPKPSEDRHRFALHNEEIIY
jgi:hypothetical protein